jgi:hypothetical protein
MAPGGGVAAGSGEPSTFTLQHSLPMRHFIIHHSSFIIHHSSFIIYQSLRDALPGHP